MSLTTQDQLTHRERLTRGLRYSAVGPVDVTRGALGIGADSARSSAAWVRDRYQRGQLRRELTSAQQTIALELAAAQDVVTGLPQALQSARRSRRRRKPVLLAVAAVVGLAGGAVAFSIVRRSMQPEPSPLPPSVEVQPKP